MERTEKNKKILLFSTIAILIIILGLGTYGYFKILKTDLFYKGISIEEYDISFMTKEEALKFIKNKKEPEIEESSMKLTYGDKEYDIGLKELGFFYDYQDAIDKVYSIGRKGNIFKRIKDIANARKKGIGITLNSGYDEKAMIEVIDNIAEEIDKEPKDAEFKLNGGNIQITDEIMGEKVDKKELNKLMSNNIYDLKPIKIPIEETTPTKTKELLSRINGVIGEFSTSFGNSSGDRIENIKISSRAITNRGVIMPGETVSFNETTGPREKRFGYKEANVIIGGEFTPDVGGGVCQTSTTLYNALLLADMTIIERSPHSIPSTYVNFGQDAAVAYGYLDLKFKNDFDYPIYIDSGVSGGRVYFRVYGDKKARDYTVKIDSQTVETIAAKVKNISDSNLPQGRKETVQQGRTGYRVNTYKSIIKDGKTISRDLITKDYYKPREFIYRVGTKTVSSPTKSTGKKGGDQGTTGGQGQESTGNGSQEDSGNGGQQNGGGASPEEGPINE